MDSTTVTKLEVHAERATALVKHIVANLIVANDDYYSVAVAA